MLQNPIQMMQQLQQFRNNFKGDARAEVMKMLQNGQINQQQLNELQQMANQLQAMMKKGF